MSDIEFFWLFFNSAYFLTIAHIVAFGGNILPETGFISKSCFASKHLRHQLLRNSHLCCSAFSFSALTLTSPNNFYLLDIFIWRKSRYFRKFKNKNTFLRHSRYFGIILRKKIKSWFRTRKLKKMALTFTLFSFMFWEFNFSNPKVVKLIKFSLPSMLHLLLKSRQNSFLRLISLYNWVLTL